LRLDAAHVGRLQVAQNQHSAVLIRSKGSSLIILNGLSHIYTALNIEAYLHLLQRIPLDETRYNSAWDAFRVTNIDLLDVKSIGIFVLLAGDDVTHTDIQARDDVLLGCSWSWGSLLLLLLLYLFLLLLGNDAINNGSRSFLNSSLNLCFTLLLLLLQGQKSNSQN
jgi:hypothetical protein